MAKNEEKVMEFVEKELKADPEVTTSELFERAKKVDSGVKKLSLRQFNARFPLQVKRRQSLAKSGGRRRRRSRTGPRRTASALKNRDNVRKLFLEFASDLSAAEDRKDLVAVIAKVDSYVDRALEAARG